MSVLSPLALHRSAQKGCSHCSTRRFTSQLSRKKRKGQNSGRVDWAKRRKSLRILKYRRRQFSEASQLDRAPLASSRPHFSPHSGADTADEDSSLSGNESSMEQLLDSELSSIFDSNAAKKSPSVPHSSDLLRGKGRSRVSLSIALERAGGVKGLFGDNSGSISSSSSAFSDLESEDSDSYTLHPAILTRQLKSMKEPQKILKSWLRDRQKCRYKPVNVAAAIVHLAQQSLFRLPPHLIYQSCAGWGLVRLVRDCLAVHHGFEARQAGNILWALGVLSMGSVYECPHGDTAHQFAGHTARKRDLIDHANTIAQHWFDQSKEPTVVPSEDGVTDGALVLPRVASHRSGRELQYLHRDLRTCAAKIVSDVVFNSEKGAEVRRDLHGHWQHSLDVLWGLHQLSLWQNLYFEWFVNAYLRMSDGSADVSVTPETISQCMVIYGYYRVTFLEKVRKKHRMNQKKLAQQGSSDLSSSEDMNFNGNGQNTEMMDVNRIVDQMKKQRKEMRRNDAGVHYYDEKRDNLRDASELWCRLLEDFCEDFNLIETNHPQLSNVLYTLAYCQPKIVEDHRISLQVKNQFANNITSVMDRILFLLTLRQSENELFYRQKTADSMETPERVNREYLANLPMSAKCISMLLWSAAHTIKRDPSSGLSANINHGLGSHAPSADDSSSMTDFETDNEYLTSNEDSWNNPAQSTITNSKSLYRDLFLNHPLFFAGIEMDHLMGIDNVNLGRKSGTIQSELLRRLSEIVREHPSCNSHSSRKSGQQFVSNPQHSYGSKLSKLAHSSSVQLDIRTTISILSSVITLYGTNNREIEDVCWMMVSIIRDQLRYTPITGTDRLSVPMLVSLLHSCDMLIDSAMNEVLRSSKHSSNDDETSMASLIESEEEWISFFVRHLQMALDDTSKTNRQLNAHNMLDLLQCCVKYEILYTNVDLMQSILGKIHLSKQGWFLRRNKLYPQRLTVLLISLKHDLKSRRILGTRIEETIDSLLSQIESKTKKERNSSIE